MPEAIDFERYLPTVLSQLVSRLRVSSDAFFRDVLGVTQMQWRILAALAAEGPLSAYRICTGTGLDKAAVSRGVAGLADLGLVAVSEVAGDARRRTAIALTPAGAALEARARDALLARHARLVAGLDQGEIEALLGALTRLDRGLGALDREEAPRHPSFRPARRLHR